ncbi:hypothetical protein [Polynucleobacter sp. AP-Kolm-20A-A1]|uniref:hypothetical protein n=1 Tax=Polynucleobacter sp. AP-Kolm-20A-A1 TaxID=2081041 RepID=UPI001BFE405B|nr:hypothetical protein [Polynucleobacter sp. AP-Kolm-20A-A1]QWE19970.1 hypothetical protein C2745_06060 [Polynucleobacter sp. AP-Kolm-20A-A1]
MKNIKQLVLLSSFAVLMQAASTVYAAPLISAKEAALPSAGGQTRGISRGPTIKVNSPAPDVATTSPFDFRIVFVPRGESKIDVDSVKVVYMKSPFVNLTPRLRDAISDKGIDFSKAEVPPGSHTIRVSVADNEGRETNSVFTLVVTK